MNRVLILITAFYLVISACTQNEGDKQTASFYPPIDTIKIAKIDTLVNQLSGQWKPGPGFHTLMLGERDSVQFMDTPPGQPQRMSALFNTDTSTVWTTIYHQDNELKMMRYREWNGWFHPSVLEALIYFENGKIFYYKERGKMLEKGEQIGIFRDLPFVENVRKPEEVTAIYSRYWETVKKGIEGYKNGAPTK